MRIPVTFVGLLFGDVINSSPPLTKWPPFLQEIFLKCISMNGVLCILIKISLKFVPKGPIDNNPALV